MRLRADQLEGHLAGPRLKPVYAIHGDEQLLLLEAADAVRAAARKHGAEEREVYEAARNFDWSEFHHATASQSLFGGRKVIELRLPSGKPSAQAIEAIVGYCARPGEDVLLLTMPRPEGAGWWKSEWFTALDGAGAVVEIEPVGRAQLPGWISRRLGKQGQRAAPEVLEFLADRVEGNLLAAHQEVQKLALLAPQGELTLEMVEDAVASVARYDPHVALEALLSQGRERYARIIEGLRAEGEQPTFVLFVLSSALFALHGIARGGEPGAMFMQHKFFNKKLQPLLQSSARRFSARALTQALAHAARIDRAIKGVGQGEDPWEEFILLGLKLADGSKA
jgi:DNA polymerase-3 subunit delta